MNSTTLSCAGLRARLREAGCVKLGHLVGASGNHLREVVGFRSSRVAERIVEEVCASLPRPARDYVTNLAHSSHWEEGVDYVFPPLTVTPAIGGWLEEGGGLLSLRTPELGVLGEVSKKALYVTCVKVSHLRSLAGLAASRWAGVFDQGVSPRGCWRSLYKAPIDKRTGDLQWRIVHGAMATNRHLAHLDPEVEEGCPFCGEGESLQHLFLLCPRLGGLLGLLRVWFQGLGIDFTDHLFIFGPRYAVKDKAVHVLVNFLSGKAKLAIWRTRKNRILGRGPVDTVLMVGGLLAARLRLEYTYYNLVQDLDTFKNLWGIGGLLCDVGEEGLVLRF